MKFIEALTKRRDENLVKFGKSLSFQERDLG